MDPKKIAEHVQDMVLRRYASRLMKLKVMMREHAALFSFISDFGNVRRLTWGRGWLRNFVLIFVVPPF